MRYLINDDDIESWIEILTEVNSEYPHPSIRYVLQEMKIEVEANINQVNDKINVRQ